MTELTQEEIGLIKKRSKELNDEILNLADLEYTIEVKISAKYSLRVIPRNKICTVITNKEEFDLTSQEGGNLSSLEVSKDNELANQRYEFIKEVESLGMNKLKDSIMITHSARTAIHSDIIKVCGGNSIESNNKNENINSTSGTIEAARIAAQKALNREKDLSVNFNKAASSDSINTNGVIKESSEDWMHRRINEYADIVKSNIGINDVAIKTEVKVDVTGLMQFSIDYSNKCLIIIENTHGMLSSANNKKHVFKYYVDTKKYVYTMNNESLSYQDLYMSTNCSVAYKKACDIMIHTLDEIIVMDNDLKEQLQKISIIENDVIDKDAINGKFIPFKKTHIE